MFKKAILVALFFLLNGVVFAQDSGRSKSAGASRVSGPSVAAPSRSVSTPSSGTSMSSRSASFGSISRGMSVRAPSNFAPNSRSSSNGPSVLIQTYSPQWSYSRNDWYRCNSFISSLLNYYTFLPGYNYMWRYAQGDSPLTRQSLALALGDSADAASALTLASVDLERIVTAYQEGRITKDEFSASIKQKTNHIRELSEKIRKDRLLDYIDQRRNDHVPSYASPKTLSDAVVLSNELANLTNEIRTGLSAFYTKDMTRVVDVKDLQRPSFDALSERVDRIAKAIAKSSRKL